MKSNMVSSDATHDSLDAPELLLYLNRTETTRKLERGTKKRRLSRSGPKKASGSRARPNKKGKLSGIFDIMPTEVMTAVRDSVKTGFFFPR